MALTNVASTQSGGGAWSPDGVIVEHPITVQAIDANGGVLLFVPAEFECRLRKRPKGQIWGLIQDIGRKLTDSDRNIS